MRVESAQVFKVTFEYEGTQLMIPIAGANQQEAMAKLRGFMLGWANELQIAAGPVPSTMDLSKPPVEEPQIDPFALQLRIEEMVKGLIPLKKPKGATTIERLVKEWTGFPMEPENFPAIIASLGRLGPNEN
jgi:hypothetical protein